MIVSFTNADCRMMKHNSKQKYLKFPGLVILNPVLMKIRIVSGSHQIGPIGEMLNPGSA
jgi:hypothetical protein